MLLKSDIYVVSVGSGRIRCHHVPLMSYPEHKQLLSIQGQYSKPSTYSL